MSNTYYQPTNLADALHIKNENDGLLILAGGTDLVIEMRNSMNDFALMSLSKIKGLRTITENDQTIRVGAMATFTDIAENKVIGTYAKALSLASASVGALQIRNRGTIGGSICNANPAADVVPVLVCLEALVCLAAITADTIHYRRIPIEQFILARHKTSIGSKELVVGVEFKKLNPQAAVSFEKIGRRKALAIARLNGACLIEKSGRTITNMVFSIGAATSSPYRGRTLEQLFIGKGIDDELLKTAGDMVVSQITALTGVRKSSVYKYPVIRKLTAKLIQSAYDEAVE